MEHAQLMDKDYLFGVHYWQDEDGLHLCIGGLTCYDERRPVPVHDNIRPRIEVAIVDALRREFPGCVLEVE